MMPYNNTYELSYAISGDNNKGYYNYNSNSFLIKFPKEIMNIYRETDILSVEVRTFDNNICYKPPNKNGFRNNNYISISEDDNIMRAYIIVNKKYFYDNNFIITISPIISPSNMHGKKFIRNTDDRKFMIKINFPNCLELRTEPIAFYNGGNKGLKFQNKVEVKKNQKPKFTKAKIIKPTIMQYNNNNMYEFFIKTFNITANNTIKNNFLIENLGCNISE
jgi:hypothetical protein